MYFICEKCGCLDLTTKDNNFYTVSYGLKSYKDEYYNTHLCCTECTPNKYRDNIWSLSGHWHNDFPKVKWCDLDPNVLYELEKENQIYNIDSIRKK